MAQFFGYRDKVSKKVLGYTSDDSAGFNQLPANLEYVGPFADQKTAQQTLEPAPVPNAVIASILAKAPATQTPADILAYLIQKFGT